jgi:hypothetical protein
MSRTAYMEEVSFKVDDDLESWKINQLWGRYIENLLRSKRKDYDINHLEQYRFELSDDDEDDGYNLICVSCDSPDSCFGGEYLARFMATITEEDDVLLEFSGESTEKWGYYVSPGKVNIAEYGPRLGKDEYQVKATPDGIIVKSVGEGEL